MVVSAAWIPLDCSDIDQLASQFSKYYMLSKEGIWFYYEPDVIYNSRMPRKVLITKKQLEEHPESKWILEYF